VTAQEFQRARSPEQREARRQAILEVAGQLLTEMPVSDVSLRELARRVGLSKTNVVRYFETREAVFFALLNRTIADWLDDLDLPTVPPAGVVGALARSLAGRPLICDLWSALGTELERNISAEAVRDFKIEHAELQLPPGRPAPSQDPAADRARLTRTRPAHGPAGRGPVAVRQPVALGGRGH